MILVKDITGHTELVIAVVDSRDKVIDIIHEYITRTFKEYKIDVTYNASGIIDITIYAEGNTYKTSFLAEDIKMNKLVLS